MKKLFELKNITYSYPLDLNKIILKDISTTIFKYDVIKISGEAGCGKTTFLNLLLGLIKPLSGEILFEDKKLVYLNIISKIGYVSQDPEDSFVGDTVLDDMLFSSNKNIDDKINEAIDTLKIKPSLLKRSPNQLSTGEAMLVRLASNLILDYNILILDEPFQGLDKMHIKIVEAVLDDLAKQHTLIVVANEWKSDKINREFVFEEKCLIDRRHD